MPQYTMNAVSELLYMTNARVLSLLVAAVHKSYMLTWHSARLVDEPTNLLTRTHAAQTASVGHALAALTHIAS